MNRDIPKESDKYFLRNKHDQESFTTDIFHDHLMPLVSKGMKILEVGCMNGYRLHDLTVKKGAECYGIDPSHLAIEDGKKLFPVIHLAEGPSHQLPYTDAEFDIVYMNFVLYCVPRHYVLRTLSEMDRVLKDGGQLIMADFFPDAPHRRPDKHAEGQFSYKFNFWEPFIATNMYKEVARKTYGFRLDKTADPSRTGGDDDCILVDMQKSLEGFFPIRNL